MRELLADLTGRLAALGDDPALAARLAAVVADLRAETGSPSALDRVCGGFGLSPFERDVVVLAGLPEEHEGLTHLARLLHPRGEPRLAMATVAAALGLDAGGRRHLREALEAGPLHAHGIVTADGTGPLPEAGL